MWQLGAALIWVALSGCSPSESKPAEPKELETVDVDGGLDAQLSTEHDERAKQVGVELGGVLPSDFPEGMPVFSPSSVVDFGPGFVELDTPVPAGEVRSSLGGQIQRSGWTVDSIGDGGSSYSRDGFGVRVAVTDVGSGTRIRYEY